MTTRVRLVLTSTVVMALVVSACEARPAQTPLRTLIPSPHQAAAPTESGAAEPGGQTTSAPIGPPKTPAARSLTGDAWLAPVSVSPIAAIGVTPAGADAPRWEQVAEISPGTFLGGGLVSWRNGYAIVPRGRFGVKDPLRVRLSPDGVVWRTVPLPMPPVAVAVSGSTSDGGRLLIFGYQDRPACRNRDPGISSSCIDHPVIWTTTDGRTWQRSSGWPGPAGQMFLAAWPVPGGWEASVGLYATSSSCVRGGGIWSSRDGLHWRKAADLPTASGIVGGAASNDGTRLVWDDVCQPESRSRFWTSMDGRSWREIAAPSTDIVRFWGAALPPTGPGRPWVLPSGDTIWVSVDLISWSSYKLPPCPGQPLSGCRVDLRAASGGAHGYTVWAESITLTSIDGWTWTFVPSAASLSHQPGVIADGPAGVLGLGGPNNTKDYEVWRLSPPPDPATTPRWVPVGTTDLPLANMVGFKGGYVATLAGFGPSPEPARVAYSSDGRAWEAVLLPDRQAVTGTNENATTVELVESDAVRILAVGSEASHCATVVGATGSAVTCDRTPVSWVSTNGRAWNRSPLWGGPADRRFVSVWAIAGGWEGVAVDSSGAIRGEVWRSVDGLTWARRATIATPDSIDGGIASAAGRRITWDAMGADWRRTSLLWKSSDGVAWSRVLWSQFRWRPTIVQAAAAGNTGDASLWVLAGVAIERPHWIVVWTSPDLVHWTRHRLASLPGADPDAVEVDWTTEGVVVTAHIPATTAGGSGSARTGPEMAPGPEATLSWLSQDGRSWTELTGDAVATVADGPEGVIGFGHGRVWRLAAPAG